jgi:hypothetical protein
LAQPAGGAVDLVARALADRLTQITRASFFLHRDESLFDLQQRVAKVMDLQRASLDYTFVDLCGVPDHCCNYRRPLPC